MKLKLQLAVATAALVTQASAVQLTFSVFGPGNQTVLSDNTGTAVTGLSWGLIVDNAGDGFAAYGSSSPDATLTTGAFNGTDDIFVSGGQTRTFAGSDGVASLISFNYEASPGGVTDIQGGESYALIWFVDSDEGSAVEVGDSYGLLTDAAFVLPASNSAAINLAELRGVTNVASLTFGAVPEPSTALLGLLGLAGVLRRRR